MRRTTWCVITLCGLFVPAVLQAQTGVTGEQPAFLPPPPPSIALPASGSSDAPLLSNEPIPAALPPAPVSGALPPVSTLPGVAAPPAEAGPTPPSMPPSPVSFQPPATAFMPPPVSPVASLPPADAAAQPPAMAPEPASGMPLPPPPPPPAITGGFAPTPSMPPMPFAVSATPGTAAPAAAAQTLTPDQTGIVRKLTRGFAALRSLADDPRSNEALTRILDNGRTGAKLLGLAAFPVMPRFEARADETVVRDRSYGAWEYRKFGAFQTRLDGRILPVAGHVHADLNFTARGRSGVSVRGAMTAGGPIDGALTVEGRDAWGRPWKLAFQMSGLILRDDGLPSGGSLAVSGSDPSGRSNAVQLAFPVAETGSQADAKEKRRPSRRGRRY
ncbi:MAG TPA: hypothetical protein PLP29_06910 [Candidatus Ozemobacteraceae bacterium]|nr:hypothetical protein [Candidatus Ozemobacteraceae bacterium]